jgi:hypothetical protein
VVASDPAVRRACQRITVLNFDDRSCVAARQIEDVTERLLNCSEGQAEGTSGNRPVPATPTMGLNDNLDFMGRQLHIQTEDLGYTGRYIQTQVFCEGRVLLSTKSEYPPTVQSANDRGQVADLMHRQHYNVIRELESKKVRILRPA